MRNLIKQLTPTRLKSAVNRLWLLAKKGGNLVRRVIRLLLHLVRRLMRRMMHFLKRAFGRIFFVPSQLLIIFKNILKSDRPLSQLGRNSIFVDPKLSSDPNAQAVINVGADFQRSKSRTAFIISYTGVSNEPRVLRQASSLSAAGWKVVIFGHQGNSENPSDCLFVRVPVTDPYLPVFRKWLMICRSNFGGLGRYIPFLTDVAA